MVFIYSVALALSAYLEPERKRTQLLERPPSELWLQNFSDSGSYRNLRGRMSELLGLESAYLEPERKRTQLLERPSSELWLQNFSDSGSYRNLRGRMSELLGLDVGA